jgi:hypothetical protein
MIRLNQLLKEETFTATNKQSGKTSVFKSKDSRDAAIKAGTHDAMKDKEQPSALKAAGSDMFGGDYAKDRGGEAPKGDTNLAPKADMGVDSVVYNKRTKTVGIVRMGDERGETKTDADGNVNTDELEPYNPMKYPHQKDAQVAPSTTKEIDSRGLWKPFSQSANEPKKIEAPTDALPKEIYNQMEWGGDDEKDFDYLSNGDDSIRYGITTQNGKYYIGISDINNGNFKKIAITKNPEEAAQIFMKNLDAVKSKYNLDVDSTNEGTIRLTKLMENDPCWKGYKQVGMKDKNGREVPNCVPEGVVNEQTSYAFGKQQYTQKTLTPSQILDLATAYVNVPNLEKIFNGKLDNIVNVANDLARLNGTTQLDAKTRGKNPALILSLLKNKLLSKDDYVKLYRNLIEKQILTVKRLKNADPASRMIKGAAARQAYKDMKGEFDETD